MEISKSNRIHMHLLTVQKEPPELGPEARKAGFHGVISKGRVRKLFPRSRHCCRKSYGWNPLRIWFA
jgi:hypothetical protein